MDGRNREKEKAHILQTWVVVVERCIVLFPAVDGEFDKAASAQSCVGDVVLLLQVVQDGERLVLEACAEPFRQRRSPADPFARSHQVGDALYPAVGGAEVGVGAECHVTKKIGASVGTDVPIFHKAAEELTVEKKSILCTFFVFGIPSCKRSGRYFCVEKGKENQIWQTQKQKNRKTES